MKFVAQLLENMGLRVDYPITVRVDNVGAIFMAENITTSARTKHIDIRYKFVNEYVGEGGIRIIFVRSIDNRADGFTKNLKEELMIRHNSSMLDTVVEEIDDEKLDDK